MSAMLKDEISILKAVSIKLNDDTILIATFQYHTEEKEDSIGKKKNDRSKSFYRWCARVDSLANFKKMIEDMTQDDARLQKNTWPNDKLPYHILVNKNNDNYSLARFFATKLKKAVSWEDGVKMLNGFKKKTAKSEAHYNSGAKYQVEEYTAEDGDIVNLTDKEALLKHVGQNLFHDVVMKSHLPKANSSSKAA